MCFDNDKLTTTPCSALGPVTSPLGGGAPGKLHAAEFGFWIGVILGGLLFSGALVLLVLFSRPIKRIITNMVKELLDCFKVRARGESMIIELQDSSSWRQ